MDIYRKEGNVNKNVKCIFLITMEERKKLPPFFVTKIENEF